MLLEEARRENRRRIVVLGSCAFVNYWVIVGLVVGAAAGPVVQGWADLGAGALGGALLMALYFWLLFRFTARATVKNMGAYVLTPGEWPKTTNLVDGLAIATGTPPVRVAVLDDPVPNALTVGAGPSRSVIVITTGLVASLTRDELEAVLAVQLAEISRLDVALRTIVVSCSRGASAIFEFFDDGWKDPRAWPFMALTWPTMAVGDLLRRMAFRAGDFGADDMAVATTRHPDALRSALQHLLDDPRTVRAVDPRNAPLWFEPVPTPTEDAEHRHLLLRRYGMTAPLEERIARLPGTAPPRRPRRRVLRATTTGVR